MEQGVSIISGCRAASAHCIFPEGELNPWLCDPQAPLPPTTGDGDGAPVLIPPRCAASGNATSQGTAAASEVGAAETKFGFRKN